MQGITQMLSNKVMADETQKNNFVNSILHSNDLKKLTIDNQILQYVDSLAGVPKILLTVFGKYVESRSV
jgi:hypothetical protein